MKLFREEGFLFPRRLNSGLQKGVLDWGKLPHWLVLSLLHNPRNAGAYFYGRTRTTKHADGSSSYTKLPRDQWHTLIPNAHDGYITWEEFEDNQRRLLEYTQAHGLERRKSPPGEGPALLQGIVICGICGRRMSAQYGFRKNQLYANYRCHREGAQFGGSICQHITGNAIDEAVGNLLLEKFTPITLNVALAVQQELVARLEEANHLRE